MSNKTKMTPKEVQELMADYDAAAAQALKALHMIHIHMDQHRARYLREMSAGTRVYGMGDMHVVRNTAETLCARLREGIDK